MSVAELIEELKKMPQDSIVVWDFDSHTVEAITKVFIEDDMVVLS